MFAKYFWAIFNFNPHVHLFYTFCFGLVKGFLILLPLQRTTSLFHWLLVSFLICINSSLIQYIPSLHSFQFPLSSLYSPPSDRLQTPSFPKEEQTTLRQQSIRKNQNTVCVVCMCVCVLYSCVHVWCVCTCICRCTHNWCTCIWSQHIHFGCLSLLVCTLTFEAGSLPKDEAHWLS